MQKLSIIILMFGVCLLPLNILGISIYNFLILVCSALNINILVNFFNRHKFISIFVCFSIIITAFSSINVFNHLVSSVAFLLTVFGIVLFLELTHIKKNREFTSFCFKFYLVLVLVMAVLEFSGAHQFYYGGGERFGFNRPYLFANPISLAMSVLGAMLYLNRSYLLQAIGFSSLLAFSSFTAVTSYILTRSIFIIAIIFFVIIYIIFSSEFFQNYGSFLIRFNLLVFVFHAISDLTNLQIFSGLGLRNLDEFNLASKTLFLTNDITYFAKVFLESGVL